MAEIKIRKLDDEVVAKIDRAAKKVKVSREEYLRRQLAYLSMADELKSINNKYENLVMTIADVIKQHSEKMEEVNETLKSLQEGLWK